MCRPSMLSAAQLDEMAALRERGWGVTRIAEHLSGEGKQVSASTVTWHCKRLGADAPPRLRGRCFDLHASYRRGGRVVRPWTPADDERLLAMEAEGRSLSSIGRALGRANSSVRGRLFTLARREARRVSAKS